MRIGVTIEQFCPTRGGAEHWTYQLTCQLVQMGHEVHVVAVQFGPEAAELPIVAHRLRKPRTRLHLARLVEDKLRSLPLDVIHDMGIGWYCDIIHSHDGSRFAQWEQKLKLLPPKLRPLKRRLIEVLPRYSQFRKLVSRQFADRGQIVLALSEMVARDYRRYHDVRPERIRLVYNGVDTEKFSPDFRAEYREPIRRRLGVGVEEVLFLFVGHDFQRKGLATALRAMGRLAGEGLPARMAVVGGKRLGPAQRLAWRSGAQRAVDFLGSIHDPVPYYVAADAYVLPTFYDPCSLGVLEAAACGLPSVTTPFNGAGEMLTEGVDGFLVEDANDDRALAERLRTLLDPAVRWRMGGAARQLALNHTLQHNCRQIAGLYEEVTRRRRAA
jgi:UDP-glucose:(heptosyl)LPS alpha-1,3-glucosyltransferase